MRALVRLVRAAELNEWEGIRCLGLPQGGDISEIMEGMVSQATVRYGRKAGAGVVKTELLAGHAKLLGLLVERAGQAITAV